MKSLLSSSSKDLTAAFSSGLRRNEQLIKEKEDLEQGKVKPKPKKEVETKAKPETQDEDGDAGLGRAKFKLEGVEEEQPANTLEVALDEEKEEEVKSKWLYHNAASLFGLK